MLVRQLINFILADPERGGGGSLLKFFVWWIRHSFMWFFVELKIWMNESYVSSQIIHLQACIYDNAYFLLLIFFMIFVIHENFCVLVNKSIQAGLHANFFFVAQWGHQNHQFSIFGDQKSKSGSQNYNQTILHPCSC